MESILECGSFDITIQDKRYYSEGFKLEHGQIIHLSCQSNFRAENFLYLIAGLHTERNLTRPNQDNSRLERQAVETSIESLSFIKFEGNNIYELSKIDRARKIGFIFENPDIAIFGRNVIDDYFKALEIIHKEPSTSSLIKYGLYEKIDRQTNVLSGGEKHRLICAKAFERNPRLIIADFSSSNLDKQFLESFLEWLLEFVNLNNAIILHGLSDIELKTFNSKVIAHLYGSPDGKISFETPPQHLFPAQEEIKKVLRNKLEIRDVKDIIHVFSDVHAIEYSTKPFSFDLRENEIIIIEGVNGSGKSTLGKIITRKIKKYYGLITPLIKTSSGIALQFPERSFIYWSVFDELPNTNILELCGIIIDEYQTHPRNLSRSKQKLLSIATALYYSEKITVLDEPTTSMDFSDKIKFISLLNYFHDKTIVVLNHDPVLTNIQKTLKIT